MASLSVKSTSTKISTGSYVGDSSANKAITHGLGVVPKLVVIVATATSGPGILIPPSCNYILITSSPGGYSVTAADTNLFYVGNATSYPNSMNQTGVTYYWTATG